MIPGGLYLSKLLVDLSKLTPGEEVVIGEGNFGKVTKGTIPAHRKKPEIRCAIKILKYTDFDEDERQRFLNEVGCQASLKHDAILPLLGCSIPIMTNGDYAIVTEYMPHGSLKDYIADIAKGTAESNDKWNTIRAINIFGIAAGMAFVHQSNVIHRDLKTDNIMLDKDYNPKIADFGFSKVFEEGTQDQVNMTRKIGTPLYMAPELLLEQNYGNKVDVFAYAMLLYELFTLRKPWSDRPGFKDPKFNLVAYLDKGQRPTIKTNEIPDSFKDLIEQCWDSNPENRPTFIEIVQRLEDKDNEFFDFDLVDEEDFYDYVDKVKKGLKFDYSSSDDD